MKLEDISELVDVMVDSRVYVDLDVCKEKVPSGIWDMYMTINDPFIIDAIISQKEKALYVTIGDFSNLKYVNVKNNVRNKTVEFKYVGTELRIEYKDMKTLEFLMIALGIKRDMLTITT